MDHRKTTEDHYHKGGLVWTKICQTEGAHERNDYSQDQLSMCGSKCDVFKVHYWLSQDSSYKEVYNLEGGLTPYLKLESNEYQLFMVIFESNVAQKLCNLFLGWRGEFKMGQKSSDLDPIKTVK